MKLTKEGKRHDVVKQHNKKFIDIMSGKQRQITQWSKKNENKMSKL